MPSWTRLPESSVAAALEADPRNQPEREIGLRDAYTLIRRCLAGHDVEVFVDDRAGFTAAYADINGLETESKYTHGAGKGDRCEAVVGALAELTEHFFSGPDHIDPQTVHLGRSGVFPALVRREPSLTRLFAEQPDAAIGYAGFRPVDDPGADEVPVPLYLWAPWYAGYDDRAVALRAAAGDTADLRTAVTSSVNSGCAFGATVAEAVLHGLNELIERDALALFLRRTFVTPGPTGATRLRVTDSFLAQQAQLAGPDVTLLDVRSDLGVPVVLAVRPGLDGFAAYGAGCSVSRAHAAKRALSELVQCDAFHAWPEVAAGRDRTRRVLRGYPQLLRAARLELFDGLLDELPEAELEPPHAAPPVASQVRDVTAVLRRAGFTPLHRVLRSFGDTGHVVQVQVPGLDRFSQILEGRLATPVSLRPAAVAAAAAR